jgi:hypothetical protein
VDFLEVLHFQRPAFVDVSGIQGYDRFRADPSYVPDKEVFFYPDVVRRIEIRQIPAHPLFRMLDARVFFQVPADVAEFYVSSSHEAICHVEQELVRDLSDSFADSYGKIRNFIFQFRIHDGLSNIHAWLY